MDVMRFEIPVLKSLFADRFLPKHLLIAAFSCIVMHRHATTYNNAPLQNGPYIRIPRRVKNIIRPICWRYSVYTLLFNGVFHDSHLFLKPLYRTHHWKTLALTSMLFGNK